MFDDGRGRSPTRASASASCSGGPALIDEHAEELAQLESTDVGHPITDARNVDVPGARNCIAWYAEAIDKVYGEIAPTGPTRSR